MLCEQLGVKSRDIGIICPYSAQKEFLLQMQTRGVVNTIDSFQVSFNKMKLFFSKVCMFILIITVKHLNRHKKKRPSITFLLLNSFVFLYNYANILLLLCK